MLDYLRFDLANELNEQFRALYLNGRHELVAEETIARGTIDSAPFYAREVIGRAIEFGAASLIVVHNHPSGDPQPSREDVDCTRSLASLCAGLGIVLLDHVVVGRHAAVSLRQAGLLQP